MPRLAGRSLDLRHDGQSPAFLVVEEGHPFFHAVIVAMNNVRRAGELHTAGFQRGVRRADVLDAEIENRLGRAAIALGEEKPDAATIEEGKIPKGMAISYNPYPNA